MMRNLRESGQSTVEFALTLLLFMAILMFFVHLSMVFAMGNYIHYATFMSARAYLAAGATENDQQDRAKSVIVTMLKKSAFEPGTDKFPSIVKGVDGDDGTGLEMAAPTEYQKNDRRLSWLQGVRYNFRSKLFLIPLIGSGRVSNSVNSLTLKSESWLGRESSEQECATSIKGIYDNGC